MKMTDLFGQVVLPVSLPVILPLILPFFLSACTQLDLDHRKAEGTVAIVPVWDALSRPASACYHFYTADGEEPVHKGEEVPAESYSLVLPVGGYHALAYNTDALGVTFTGLERRHSAEVRLASDAHPEGIYSWNVDNLEVPLRSTVEHKPVPRNLVKRMTLHFLITGVESSMKLNGRLNGVYPSLLLLSGAPSAASSAAAPETSVRFSATPAPARAGGEGPALQASPSTFLASADIRLLGLLSPEYGSRYDCRLYLQVSGASGDRYEASVDMNRTVTEIIASYDGELPPDKTIEVSIGVNLLNTVLTAAVKGWTEGSGEGEVGT